MKGSDMARYQCRKEAAKYRVPPKPTTKAEQKAMSVQATAMSDAQRSGEKVPDHTEMFDRADLADIKKRVAKQTKDRKATEAKAKSESVDYEKDFGEESPGEGKDAAK